MVNEVVLGAAGSSPTHPVMGPEEFSLQAEAVRKLRPANEVSVSVSSRTDSGVHALCNSAHVDIQRKSGKPPFTERLLVDALNYHLKPEPISEATRPIVPEDNTELSGFYSRPAGSLSGTGVPGGW
ncbi:UNVERIFIED_CONTAM: hypothetical protein FKN15_008025 [Acipenser sinensis]